MYVCKYLIRNRNYYATYHLKSWRKTAQFSFEPSVKMLNSCEFVFITFANLNFFYKYFSISDFLFVYVVVKCTLFCFCSQEPQNVRSRNSSVYFAIYHSRSRLSVTPSHHHKYLICYYDLCVINSVLWYLKLCIVIAPTAIIVNRL